MCMHGYSDRFFLEKDQILLKMLIFWQKKFENLVKKQKQLMNYLTNQYIHLHLFCKHLFPALNN